MVPLPNSRPVIVPDLLLLNANIHTMDPARPAAEALAVIGERIVAVGSTEELRPLAGNGTRIVDAEGALVLPGFNDAHVHFLTGGFSLSEVDLRSATSPEEFTRRIAAHGAGLASGRWVVGGNWDHELWPGSPLPRREWIDAATADRPVFVKRLDWHMALANSVALKLSGITKDTPDPDGGLIVRDPRTGDPTGLLKDTAMDLVTRAIPAPTMHEKLEAARAATRYAASLGVTSVTDVLAGVDVGLYQTLRDRGELLTRIYAVTPMPQFERLLGSGVHQGFGDDWLRVGACKAFSDGSLGSGTALFFDDYSDEPGNRGLPAGEMFPEGELLRRMLLADAAGQQLITHAIGDRANHLVLEMYEEVVRQHASRDRRLRIEHAQHLRPQDVGRFSRSKIIASVQPYHMADDARWLEKRIGSERARTTYAFRSLLDSGATLALGTDWTVAPLNPLLTLAAAVTRQPVDGSLPGGWNPEQKLTVEEAVRAYTVGSAFAEFTDQSKGTLSPGKLADFVLIDRDLFTVPPEEIGKAKVLRTVVGGTLA